MFVGLIMTEYENSAKMTYLHYLNFFKNLRDLVLLSREGDVESSDRKLDNLSREFLELGGIRESDVKIREIIKEKFDYSFPFSELEQILENLSNVEADFNYDSVLKQINQLEPHLDSKERAIA